MPVEKPDVIDFIAHFPKTNEVSLVMVEARDWNAVPEAVEQLEVKLRAYAECILSGALARQDPKNAHCPVRVELHHFTPIPAQVAAVLRQWAGKFSGIPVALYSHRMYWNPLITFIQKLIAKFTGPQHGYVRWMPEPGATEPLLTPAQFAEEYISAMRKKMPDLQVQIVQNLEIKVTTASGKESNGLLTNAYNQYRITPENKDTILQKYTAGLLEALQIQEQPLDKSRIVPVVKDKAWIQEMVAFHKAREGKAVEHVHEPYNEELIVVYAVDTPTNIRYLNAADLKELQVEASDLRNLACANLERLLPAPDIQLEGGLYRIKAGGDYDASLLLMESLWTTGKIPVAGQIVAAIPARDWLLVTGSEDETGMEKIRALAQAIAAQAPYRLTPRLFIYEEGQFVSYEL